ncbi:MAG: hypothetical protein ISS68_00410 [Desulfobacteraceae bacterium]|nr:hypothetical protein [Desulfobacteraceae bacterium]
MRKKGRFVTLLIFTGILLLSSGLFTGAGAQTGVKAPAAPMSGADDAVQGPTTGIDVSDLTDVQALGFLSVEEVKPWGKLFADETEKLLLAKGDTVYVAFEKGHHIKPGDLFTVYRSSQELDHPLTGSDMGYVISFLGRLVLEKEVKTDLFKAEIVESYEPIRVGDPVLPFAPVSPCVQPSSPQWERLKDIDGAKLPIVATKNLNEIAGQFSVVYMNHGHKHGIRRGNFFEIVSKAESDQPKEPALPDQVLGYLLVLEAKPNTSTGIVITASREFSSGTMLKTIDLTEALKKVLTLYGVDRKDSDIENNPLQILDRLVKETDAKLDLPDALRLLIKMPQCQIK